MSCRQEHSNIDGYDAAYCTVCTVFTGIWCAPLPATSWPFSGHTIQRVSTQSLPKCLREGDIQYVYYCMLYSVHRHRRRRRRRFFSSTVMMAMTVCSRPQGLTPPSPPPPPLLLNTGHVGKHNSLAKRMEATDAQVVALASENRGLEERLLLQDNRSAGYTRQV